MTILVHKLIKLTHFLLIRAYFVNYIMGRLRLLIIVFVVCLLYILSRLQLLAVKAQCLLGSASSY